MMLRLMSAVAGLAAPLLFAAPAFAATPQQKMETCKFGADDKKLTGAARKSFISKCMSNADSPRGKPAMPRPNPQ
jgi:psiF repeat